MSLTPELDVIDELFWRMAHGKPTSSIATPQVVALLRPLIGDAKGDSRKIDRNWFSTGMLGDVAVRKLESGERFCFVIDKLGPLYFTLARAPGGRLTITAVAQPEQQDGVCPAGG